MKKLLVLLFSILISFNSYGLFEKTVCVETDGQERVGDDPVLWIIYLPNKTKPFSGKNLCKYENGQKKSEGKYKNGKQEGKWTEWYENGQVRVIDFYKNGRSFKDGKFTFTRWHENGQKFIEFENIDGKIQGNYTRWNENGQIILEAIFKDDECISGECPY